MSENLTEKSSSINQLIGFLQTRIPQAMTSPITKLKADWQLMVGSYHKDKKVKGYEEASVAIPYAIFEALSDYEFQILKTKFSDIVLRNLESQVVPKELINAINPNSPQNILEHERDHGMPLPDGIRENATINIIFLKEPGGENSVQGIEGRISYDADNTSYYYSALSCTEPQSLNATDIEQARLQAQKTGDLDFIEQIEERIKSRLCH